jgi:hypothetical protein
VFKASQYGAVLFTSDKNSRILGTDIPFADAVVATCANVSASVNYSDASQCAKRFGGLGYVIQVSQCICCRGSSIRWFTF